MYYIYFSTLFSYVKNWRSVKNENGQWTGHIGAMLNGTIDSCCSVGIFSARMDVVNFLSIVFGAEYVLNKIISMSFLGRVSFLG